MKSTTSSRPTISHIAIRANDPENVAALFMGVFEMTLQRRRKKEEIDLTDGSLNLAILPLNSAGQHPGIEHLGFAVGDEDAIREKLEKAGGKK